MVYWRHITTLFAAGAAQMPLAKNYGSKEFLMRCLTASNTSASTINYILCTPYHTVAVRDTNRYASAAFSTLEKRTARILAILSTTSGNCQYMSRGKLLKKTQRCNKSMTTMMAQNAI